MQKLGLGWTLVYTPAGDPTVGIRAGQVVGISRQGITVDYNGVIEKFTQSEVEDLLFVKED